MKYKNAICEIIEILNMVSRTDGKNKHIRAYTAILNVVNLLNQDIQNGNNIKLSETEKKARCWDKLKKETEDSIWMEEVGYIGVIQEIEQEVEADET